MSKYGPALDEARRALDRQAQDLAGIRTRMSALLGIAGTLVSVLGGLAIRDNAELSCWTFVAVGGFVLLSCVGVFVMWPRKVSFSHDPKALIDAADVPEASADDIEEHLARQMGDQYESNNPTLNQLVVAFGVAVVIFAVQVIALLVDLRGR